MADNLDLFYLLLLLKNSGKIYGRKRIQKLVYLLKNLGGVKFSYNFVPHYYGPYSWSLKNDLDLLEALGLVVITGHDPYIFSLTEKGKKLANRVSRKYSKQEEKMVNSLKKLGMDTDQLVEKSKEVMRRQLGYNPWA